MLVPRGLLASAPEPRAEHEVRREIFFRRIKRIYDRMVPGEIGWKLCPCCGDIAPLDRVAMISGHEPPTSKWIDMCHLCSSAAFNTKQSHRHRYST